jgi:Ca-activated chloride channel homolog
MQGFRQQEGAKQMSARVRRSQTLVRVCIAVALLTSTTTASRADELNCADDAMIVFDASGSMMRLTDVGSPRIDLAREAAHQVMPAAARNRNLGLMIYGPGGADQCINYSVAVPVQANAADAILNEIDAITTEGETPLSAAVEAAADALDYKNRPAVIVVLTDGDENCGREPCEIARTLIANAYKLTIHIIGFKLGSRPRFQAACFAEETNGLFIPTNSMEELTEALQKTLVCPQITSASPSPLTRLSLPGSTDRSTSR